MQERVLKLAIVVLTALLAGLIALGAILVMGTQNGQVAGPLEAAYHEAQANTYSPDPLPVEDKPE